MKYRRPARADKVGIVVELRTKHTEPAQPSTSDVAEYERHIEFLQTRYETKKWSVSNNIMLTLL